ncbi:MAG TPA: hypothetical protein VK932_18985 [Kofleriaceae bacterium]|nr:hypothetical protein [Kofleriaceae bacterium]
MTEPLRPHVATASSRILDVAAEDDGGYAVLTGAGIERFDAALAPRGEIAGEHTGTLLRAVPGGRFLVHGTSMSWLYAGAAGTALARVDLGGGLVRSVAVTERGFLAIGTDGVLVDQAGARTLVTLAGRLDFGGTAWRGGAVVAGHDGLAILGADGAIVAQSSEAVSERPVALANAIAVPGREDVVVFDGDARVIARIPREVSGDALVAFGDGVLVTSRDEDGGETRVGYWELADGAAIERWGVASGARMQPPVIAGDRIVLASSEAGARILGAGGVELAHLTTAMPVEDVAPFGGGIALIVRDAPDVSWWRPDAPLASLPHDVWPSLLRAVPAGLASSEGRALYVWRTDVQGPELAPIETDLPMKTPIVIRGTPVQIVAVGRFALRGMTLAGHPWRIQPDAAWRPLTSPGEAARLLERLVQRTFDGPLPSISGDAPIREAADRLAQLPLAETVDLHGRAMFASSSLDPGLRARAAWARAAFFAELGAALGASGRALLAAVKARKLKLEPPRPVPGYEYLGTFTTSGNLTVGDPCHAGKKVPAGVGFALSLKVAGHEGVWHVLVRAGAGADRDRTAELVAIHDDGFDVVATDAIGSIGVDSGTAGVFDVKCPRRDGDAPLEEGSFAALGAIASTGYGDGLYPVFAGRLKGRVAKLRLHFLGGEPEVDRSVARSTAAPKPYSASARFARGDTVEHGKFGTGAVVRVGTDGKIDVRFADGIRTLVHARK